LGIEEGDGMIKCGRKRKEGERHPRRRLKPHKNSIDDPTPYEQRAMATDQACRVLRRDLAGSGTYLNDSESMTTQSVRRCSRSTSRPCDANFR
jgi:hypothetical protein